MIQKTMLLKLKKGLKKMKDKIMEKVLPMANAISNNQFLVSLRDGFMVAFPATMFASIAMIIQNFPQTFRFDGFLPQAVLDFLNNFFGPVGNATMNVSSVFVVFGIAYTLGKKLKCNPLYAGAIALASFFMLLPFQVVKDVTYMPLPKLGAQGMFVGILTAFIATEIFAFLENKDITIKMPEQIPQGIANSFTSILPGAVTLMVFNIIRYIFTFTKWGNAFDCLFTILQRPLTNLGSSLPATIIAVILAQLLWWFGVHGQAVVNSVMDPIWNTLALENYAAYSAGAPIPHIVCSTFMGIFPLIGGNGMTLGIILVALIIARSVRLKSTMKMVVAPAFFNISEPVTFGLPIVLNPTILIPWVLAPVVTVITSYCAIYFGLVPRPIGVTVIWTTPVFLSGWIGTSSIRGGILQLVNVVISIIIWLPFMKALDKIYLKDEEEAQVEE